MLRRLTAETKEALDLFIQAGGFWLVLTERPKEIWDFVLGFSIPQRS